MQPHDEWHPQRDPMAPREEPEDSRVIIGALIAIIVMGFVIFWPRGGPNTTETALKSDAPPIQRPTNTPAPTPAPTKPAQ